MANVNEENQASIKDLVLKRGVQKRNITLFSSWLSEFNLEETLEQSKLVRDAKHFEIEQRFKRFEPVLDGLEEIQREIDLIWTGDPQTQLAEHTSNCNAYFSEYGRAQSILQALRDFSEREARGHPDSVDQQSWRSVLSAGNNNNNSNPEPIQNTASLQLPRIKIPEFAGNCVRWLEFRDSFCKLIHNNAALSKIEKFQFLREALKGDAANTLESIELADANYDAAWIFLQEEYHKPNELTRSHVRELLDIPKLSKFDGIALKLLVITVRKHLCALKMLGEPVNTWDTLLIHIIREKLDQETINNWELSRQTTEIPTLKDFLDYLRRRGEVLLSSAQTKQANNVLVTSAISPTAGNAHKINHFNQKSREFKCAFCSGSHVVESCASFLALSVPDRMREVGARKLCFNCLRPNHNSQACRSRFICRTCKSRHHTLLHLAKPDEASASTTHNLSSANQTSTILPTAIVYVKDVNGKQHTARVLLDSGSQSNFITQKFAEKLKLKMDDINITINGINFSTSHIKKKCNVSISAISNKYTLNTTCLVSNYISGMVPLFTIIKESLKIPGNLKLSDTDFHLGKEIDLLIGSSDFFNLLCIGQHRLGPGLPILQKTLFGWVVAGPITESAIPNTFSTGCTRSTCNKVTLNELNDVVERFWELDTISTKENTRNNDNICETMFTNSMRRSEEGNFIVKIPFTGDLNALGTSYNLALNRFHALEKMFRRNPNIKQKYDDFMCEYIDLQHMSLTKFQNASLFLPHHGVTNDNSTTTRLRVVFDASAKASCGQSLNDMQPVGPTVQEDLLTILLRFRLHKYVISADIEKMYRQILVDEEQRKFQCILWRFTQSEPIRCYQLNTVTYGLRTAPFLATRCLVSLADEVENTDIEMAKAIRESFYVDDLIIGFDEEEEAIRMCRKIRDHLKTASFHLRKWVSNSTSIIRGIGEEVNNYNNYEIKNPEISKTLGINWNTVEDTLFFCFTPYPSKRITKRSILSETASIFDPMGLVAPCVVKAKLIIQKLWADHFSWDESLPIALATEWLNYKQNLDALNQISLRRYVGSMENNGLELHGFCDASAKAYGACIYGVKKENDKYVTNILFAKSRVAPLKAISIPRLELCAALLLAEMFNYLKTKCHVNDSKFTFWSDSMVVLYWLKRNPKTLKSFISNRVERIQLLTNEKYWKHVPGHENPADLVSRGCNPDKIVDMRLWWNGPLWLEERSSWPKENIQCDIDFSELNTETIESVINHKIEVFQPIIDVERYSKINTLIRVVGYVFRFVDTMKKRNKLVGVLTVDERKRALDYIIKCEQEKFFIKEIKQLHTKSNLNVDSKLISLTPFLEDNKILRVGGRLKNSLLPYDAKHQIILPQNSYVTTLLVRDAHNKLLHAGPLNTLNYLRQKYWPIHGRSVVRKVLHNCVICRRAAPKIIQPQMADLPASRINECHPFEKCGIDYAGPFKLKSMPGRGGKIYKGYIALFVCFTTRAIHLELVTELSSNAFIACFRRFVSRRGLPAHVYTDNGTNFVGANRELNEIIENNTELIQEELANNRIRWHFIPAHSPNFGGLWEAGVKSAKYHLARVVLGVTLTYEQFNTCLVQIEAILNSRPMSALSSDPSDMQALTPAHFLLGRPMNTAPDVDVTDAQINRLDQYRRLQAIIQGFWKRWRMEYLNQLQQRGKWKNRTNEIIKEGDLVTILDPHTPPMSWKLGRVVQLHPGANNQTRVVSVKSTTGTVLKRAVTKVALLPVS